ncbi:MAG: putative nucleotidyltransferase substrate binding domain-containing protein [Burkholderiaceae bacterium]|nr:putative nucleotidyltransferase substrate binding domain-containing protein [Burkholderiaceae bacterium]
MPNAFNFAASPFDCLSPDEQRLVRASVDIVYFREGETLLGAGMAPTHLWVLIKGHVTQFEGDEVIATYGPDDCFDGRALMAGKVIGRFVAAEEVLAYALAHQAVSDLIASNATFGALLFSDLGHKLSALAQRQSQHQLQSLMLARVDQAFVRPAPVVQAQDDIVAVVRVFQAQRTANVLVRDAQHDPPRLGIFTATGLQRAILDGRPLDQLAVGELANFELITVRPSDLVGDAMALMLGRRVHRLVVVEGDQVLGFIEALDLFSFLANDSHRITLQIEQALDLDGLAQAAAQITRLLALLHRSGTRIDLMARLVQQLNARLFERAWQMIAPAELVANSCLFVMGSEGRGEQLLKTDQDNGLLLRDGYAAPADLPGICQRFSQALARFGYPDCPGRIMVSDPAWRASVAEFTQRTREWLLLPDADSLMKLAIFMDAHAVCGDAALLESVRQSAMAWVPDNDALWGRFAAASMAFGEQGSWWSRLFSLGEGGRALDLKKAGLFPLVHGVRSLALAGRLRETGTVARIEALVAAGLLTAEMGGELRHCLHFFMGLKLQAGLAEIDRGLPVSGQVDPARLSTLDRDLLKDALGVVKRFKALLRHRFQLDALS